MQRKPSSAPDSADSQLPPESVNPPFQDAAAQSPDSDLRSLEAGLDSLQSVGSSSRFSVRRAVGKVVPPVLTLLVLLAVWQFYVTLGHKRADLVPGPLDVFRSLTGLWSEAKVQTSMWTSLQRGILGFLVSAVVATPIGLLLAQVKPVRKALGPLISGLQVLPSVAWVPAAIIWFGLSDATVYFVVLMGAIPSIVNGLVAGVDQIPPQYRRVGQVLGASRWEQATRIVLPAALPGYVAGLKQGWAFSWRSLMAAEIIAMGGSIGFGLGSLLQQGRELADMGMVMAAILLILAVGILVELLVFAPLERRLLAGRGLLSGGTR